MQNDKHLIAAEIKRIRKALCLSQSAFGQQLNRQKSAVSKWEQGRCVPPVHVYLQIRRLDPAFISNSANFHNGRNGTSTDRPLTDDRGGTL